KSPPIEGGLHHSAGVGQYDLPCRVGRVISTSQEAQSPFPLADKSTLSPPPHLSEVHPMQNVPPSKDLAQQAEELRLHARKLREESDKLLRYLKQWLHARGLKAKPPEAP